MKGATITTIMTAALMTLGLIFSCAREMETSAASEESTGQGLEREISINIHSGLRSIPIRKVIGVVITKAEKKGVEAIVSNGKRQGENTWDLSLTFLDKEKNVKKSFKWRYVKDKGELSPLNEGARSVSSLLGNFLFKAAVNMGFGMLEGQGVSPRVVDGRADRLPDGQWQLRLTGVSDNGERFFQEWSYDPKEGVLYSARQDGSDTEKPLAVHVPHGNPGYIVAVVAVAGHTSSGKRNFACNHGYERVCRDSIRQTTS